MQPILILSKQAHLYASFLKNKNGPETTFEPFVDCEIVFGEPNLIKEICSQLPNLKWVQSTWAGVEPLLDTTLRRDYQLTNARGVFGKLMSEYVFSYLLLHERKIIQRLKAQDQKQWDASLTGTLQGKTIGLLGVGSIGAEIAKTAKFFGMTVRGYTHASENCPDVDIYFHSKDLTSFVNGVDYLVSVLPGTNATRHLINQFVFEQLPQHSLFMNVGRGNVVDESALINALETESIAGAVLDVFEQEPLPAEHPFWNTKNLILTFHTSAPSLPETIGNLFLENYALYKKGLPLKHVVDFEKGY